MRILVSGGSASGKSEYAEGLAVSLAEQKQPLYYIATMLPYGKEAHQRIERHHALRQNKGFKTLECYQCSTIPNLPADAVVLLECLSNLLANEMFADNGFNEGGQQDVLETISLLESSVQNLVIVTNDISSDGVSYDDQTREYQRQLGLANQSIAARFDTVVEVVCGIPLIHKQQSVS